MKSINEFLSKLEGVRREGNQYKALCPAHNDHIPSLSISQNKNKILVKCQAGCETGDILQALNLKKSDLFIEEVESHISAVYQYQNEDGDLLFEVVRYEPKSFSQRRPDGQGGYINNLKGITPVLYHLPDVKRAIDYQDPIYLVEGEKDCDRLWQEGLVATTNPMGAKKWKPEYTKTLKGANVIFIPQTDEPGIEHARVVINELKDTVSSLRIIPLPEGSKDISEWFDNGNSIEELERLKSLPPNEYYNMSIYIGDSASALASKPLQTVTKPLQADEARAWIDEQGYRYWKVRQFDEELTVTKAYRRLLLKRFLDDGYIEKHPTYADQYRKISYDDVIDFKSVQRYQPLDIWLPFGLSNMVYIYPQSIIVFAGVSDAGKTAIALNILKNNDGKWVQDYWTNELSAQELAARLIDFKYKPPSEWQFNARKLQTGYIHKIKPDALSLFDYLDVGEPFYNIASELQQIHDAIGNGVGVVFIQKDFGAKLGRGRTFSVQLSRYYFVMEERSIYIHKAKYPKDPTRPVKNMICEFWLSESATKLNNTEWKPYRY